MTSTQAAGLVPHRQPGPLRPGDARPGRRRSPSRSQRMLGESGRISAEIVWKPVLTDAAAIRAVMLEANSRPACVGVIAWMHTFSPAKMWITGLDALRKPLLHLHTQLNEALPWSDHRHGLHEPQPGRARRPRVRLHPDPARGGPQDGRRARVATRVVAERIDGWARAATGLAHLRALRLARFGDNMRDVAVTEGDKVEAELRFGVSVNTYGVNDLVAVVDAVADARDRRAGRRVRRRLPVAPELARGRRTARVAALRRPDRGRAAAVPDDGGFGAFTTNFEDLGGLRQLPGLAVQRLMADGYGFGGEGDWKTSALLAAVKAMGAGTGRRHLVHGGLHLPLRPGRAEDPRRAHARGLPDDRRRAAVVRDPPARHRRPRGPGAAGVRRRARPGRGGRPGRPRRPIPAGGQRDRRSSPPDEPLPKLPVARAVWEPRAVALDLGRVLADRGRAAPHGADPGRRHRDAAGLRADGGHRTGADRREHDP